MVIVWDTQRELGKRAESHMKCLLRSSWVVESHGAQWRVGSAGGMSSKSMVYCWRLSRFQYADVLWKIHGCGKHGAPPGKQLAARVFGGDSWGQVFWRPWCHHLGGPPNSWDHWSWKVRLLLNSCEQPAQSLQAEWGCHTCAPLTGLKLPFQSDTWTIVFSGGAPGTKREA